MQSLFTRVRPCLRQLALLLALPLAAQAQLALPSSTPVTVDFNSLGTSATAPLPTGFVVSNSSSTGATGISYSASGNTTATTAAAGTSGTGALTGTSSGGTFNFANGATATATDRALGFLSTGPYTSPRHLLLAVQNTSSQTITDLTVAYDIEKYRAGTRAFEWQFWTSPDGSTWTQNTAATQAYAADAANAVVNPSTTTSKSVTLASLNLAAGATTYLRWSYVGIGGSTNGQGLGLDNLVLTPTLANAPVTAAITTTPSAYASPYCITSTSGSAAFDVAYTTQGTFSGTFKVQLSNASGTFPTDATSNIIGTGTGSSPISAAIPANTPSGTGYRLRVVNSSPTTLGSDNGSSLTVTLAPATNPVTVTPAADQNFSPTGSGNLLTASPTVPSGFAWFYGTAAAGPFSAALPSTSATYQPTGADFPGAGTYYVVAQATSTCGSVVGTSAAVKLVVGTVPPALTLSVTTLPFFGTVPIGSTSAARSFTVSGSSLTGDLTITPPPGFEIRTGPTAFACCAIVLSPTNGSVPTTQIDVRFAPLAAQAYMGKVALTSPGLTEQDVAVSGTGVAPTYSATVTSTAPSAVATTSASAGGTVSDDGGSPVSAYGVTYGTAAEPTTAAAHTTDGSGVGTFTSSLTGLQPGVVYYVRAYATNDQGTSYGEQYSFTTVAVPPAAEPTASSTLTVSSLSTTSVQLTFSGGTGAKHLVLAQLDGPVDQGPVDATTYTANAAFGQGQQIGSGNFVVAATADNSVTVTGLRANTPYSFASYDYNDNDTPYAENYRTSDPGTLSLTTQPLPPTLLLQEDFAYAAGTLLTADGWAAHSGGGTKPLTVTSGSLSYPGYSTGTGNATAITASGEDDNRQFATVYPRTTVYASFLVSVSNASTAGDYFLHLGPTVLSSTFRGRVFARKSATGTLQFGVVGSSATPVYTTTDYAFNTTYLLLLRYSFDETGNTTDLFINPPVSGVATTTPDLSVPENSASSPTDVGTVALRQGASFPALTLDGLTIATAFPLMAAGPLPLTLAAFTAQLTPTRTVQLAWTTASELRTDHFEVQRAADGLTFATLSSQPAAGTSAGARTYQALDSAPPQGLPTAYYRLKMVDADGSVSYSPIRAVALLPGAATGLALYPNPTQRLTTLTGAAPAAPVQVLDALGRVVLTTTADATGTASLSLPAGLASGVYVVRTGAQTRRLVLE